MLAAFFDAGNPVFKFLSTLLDLLILNVMFVISCIPIFTIGAAITSMQYVMITGWDTQNLGLFKMYVKSFKQNFKQSTIVWLIMLVAGAFFGFTGYLVYQQSKVDDGVLFMIFVIIFAIMCIVYLCIFTYVWPLIAKFENNTKTTVKNALVLALSHLPSTLIVWLIFVVAAYFIAINPVVRAFAIVFLIAVVFYFQTRVFRNVLAPYLGEDEEEKHYDGDELEYESPGVDLEHSYAEAKIEAAEMAAMIEAEDNLDAETEREEVTEVQKNDASVGNVNEE